MRLNTPEGYQPTGRGEVEIRKNIPKVMRLLLSPMLSKDEID